MTMLFFTNQLGTGTILLGIGMITFWIQYRQDKRSSQQHTITGLRDELNDTKADLLEERQGRHLEHAKMTAELEKIRAQKDISKLESLLEQVVSHQKKTDEHNELMAKNQVELTRIQAGMANTLDRIDKRSQ